MKENKKQEEKKEKYYVVRPIKESHFDEEFRVCGTKDAIAEFVKNQVDTSMEARELDFEPNHREKLYFVEFHSGDIYGKRGFGSSGVFKTIKEAKHWMIKYLSECEFDAPHNLIFKIEPVYWITVDWEKRRRMQQELMEEGKRKRAEEMLHGK